MYLQERQQKAWRAQGVATPGHKHDLLLRPKVQVNYHLSLVISYAFPENMFRVQQFKHMCNYSPF